MEFLDLAKRRFSSRKYSTQEVEEEKLMKVLEAGRVAPSAVNFQPWHFVVVREEKNRLKLAESYPKSWFREAPVQIVVCGDHGQAWKRSDGKDHCDIDASIAVDHITLAAADIGLGTCWICNFDKDKCKKALDLPAHIEPIAMLPLGYPEDSKSPDRHQTERMPLEEIIHWEKF
ncbi:MAG: nitroreductase family protein [Bacteroidales bacterium]|nr:nitroreductase family protein [Bacteroidales bacterium]